MAAIAQPTYLLIGDRNLNGANITDALAGYGVNANHPTGEMFETTPGAWFLTQMAFNRSTSGWTKGLNIPELQQSVPHDATGFPPAGAALLSMV